MSNKFIYYLSKSRLLVLFSAVVLFTGYSCSSSQGYTEDDGVYYNAKKDKKTNLDQEIVYEDQEVEVGDLYFDENGEAPTLLSNESNSSNYTKVNSLQDYVSSNTSNNWGENNGVSVSVFNQYNPYLGFNNIQSRYGFRQFRGYNSYFNNGLNRRGGFYYGSNFGYGFNNFYSPFRSSFSRNYYGFGFSNPNYYCPTNYNNFSNRNYNNYGRIVNSRTTTTRNSINSKSINSNTSTSTRPTRSTRNTTPSNTTTSPRTVTPNRNTTETRTRSRTIRPNQRTVTPRRSITPRSTTPRQRSITPRTRTTSPSRSSSSRSTSKPSSSSRTIRR